MKISKKTEKLLRNYRRIRLKNIKERGITDEKFPRYEIPIPYGLPSSEISFKCLKSCFNEEKDFARIYEAHNMLEMEAGKREDSILNNAYHVFDMEAFSRQLLGVEGPYLSFDAWAKQMEVNEDYRRKMEKVRKKANSLGSVVEQ